jgi:predicted glycosyltransferase
MRWETERVERRILIDISHPAHVHFFAEIARALRTAGHQVRIVGRDKDVTVRLLESTGLPFEVVKMSPTPGRRSADAKELVRRILALRRLIRLDRTQVVLTRNPSGVLAAVGTDARSVFDTDDGRGVGLHYWLARPFADVITSSEHDPEEHGPGHRRYRALKAQMYLQRSRFRADESVAERYGLGEDELFVVRFSAHNASHDRRIRGIAERARTEILRQLRDRGDVLTSIETHELVLHRRQGTDADGVTVRPEDFHHLMASASLCVGDSQSVAAEAAVLGVPALRLSGFTGKAFYLGHLENLGLMQNFSPGQEDTLLMELERTLSDLSGRVSSAQASAAALDADSEDLLGWFINLVEDLLEESPS